MHQLLVFSRPTVGMEQEFHQWYDDVHLAEVLEVPGFIAASRLEPLDLPGTDGVGNRYLAVYEISGDPRRAVAELLRRVANRVIDLPPCIDKRSVTMAPFSPVG